MLKSLYNNTKTTTLHVVRSSEAEYKVVNFCEIQHLLLLLYNYNSQEGKRIVE